MEESLKPLDLIKSEMKRILDYLWLEKYDPYWRVAVNKFLMSHSCRLEDLPEDHPLVRYHPEQPYQKINSSDPLPKHVPCLSNLLIVPKEDQSLEEFNRNNEENLNKEWDKYFWWGAASIYNDELKEYINRFISIDTIQIDCPEKRTVCGAFHGKIKYYLTEEQVRYRREWNSREHESYEELKRKFDDYVKTIKSERYNAFFEKYFFPFKDKKSMLWPPFFEDLEKDFSVRIQGYNTLFWKNGNTHDHEKNNNDEKNNDNTRNDVFQVRGHYFKYDNGYLERVGLHNQNQK